MNRPFHHLFERAFPLSRDYLAAVGTGYAAMAVNIGAQILLVPIYLHYLGNYYFGVLMLLLAVVNYLGAGIAWMTGGMLRVLGELSAQQDTREFGRAFAVLKAGYLAYATVLAILINSVILLRGGGFLGHLPEIQRETVLRTVMAASLYLVFAYDLAVERLALTAVRRQAAANTIYAASVLVFALLAVPYLRGGGGLEGVVWCLTAGVILSGIAARVYRRHIGLPLEWHRPDPSSMLLVKRVAGPMGMGYLLYGLILLSNQADVLLIGWLGGPAAAAQLVLVWKIGEVIYQILWRIPEHYQPYFVHMDATGAQHRVKRSYRGMLQLMLVLSAIAGASYALLGPFLVNVWVGPRAPEVGNTAYYLAGGAIFWLGIARTPAVLAYATVRLRPLLLISSLELVGKVILSLAFFRYFGFLATLVAVNVVHAGGIAWAYWRFLHPPLIESRA